MVEFDTEYTDEAVCPYCGHIHTDSWDFKEGECWCEMCDRKFYLTKNILISYSTFKIKDD